MSKDTLRIHLSLVSHTNIGKTTLARTLLSRDVGEVADRAHVTETTDEYVLARNAEGCELVLWDTPGFGNSVALAKRLEGRKNPVGWFLSEVWDRFTNKAQWLNQKALKHVRDTSSIVLYLVNAAELPDEAPYVKAEMSILAWVKKPVIVLLNQMGKPRPAKEEALDVARWNEAMRGYPIVSKVLPMDAFARCWVQEFTLLDAIGNALPEEQKAAFESLRETWSRQRRAAYAASLEALMHTLERIMNDKEATGDLSFTYQLKNLGKRLKLIRGGDDAADPVKSAQTALCARATDAFCDLTDKLIAANRLRGKGVKKELFNRLQSDWEISSPMKMTNTALAGAVGSGAVGGLAADLSTGGLSMGLGTLIGSVLGALGGVGLAIAYNTRRDAKEGTVVAWSDAAIRNFALEALLLYLAVAHFGRGRGDWAEGECPEFWRTLLSKALNIRKVETKHLPIMLDSVLRQVLSELYPDASF